ncbi:DUF998 domain-containing protein [Microbacterium gorillae]|uniref:DUF998 domain-containing protein n=1 Tax=Microbacterium gorillae TaxID=1231063 RepID=UPI000A539DCC|nr:DUF998 domain-containing protein [Microbacterium gorillae]
MSWFALVGGTIFTLAWVILGLMSPGYTLFGHRIEPYSWVSQPISGLGLGVTGPAMNAAFIVGGALILTTHVSALRAWWPRGSLARWAGILLALMGPGMIICGLFTLESMMMHLTGFLLAIPLPALGLLLAWRPLHRVSTAVARTSLLTGCASLVLFAAFMATFDATGAGGNTGYSGAIQRVLIVITMVGVLLVTTAFSTRSVRSTRMDSRAAVTR